MVEIRIHCDYKCCTAFVHISERDLLRNDSGTFTEHPPESGWYFCPTHINSIFESEEINNERI